MAYASSICINYFLVSALSSRSPTVIGLAGTFVGELTIESIVIPLIKFSSCKPLPLLKRDGYFDLKNWRPSLYVLSTHSVKLMAGFDSANIGVFSTV